MATASFLSVGNDLVSVRRANPRGERWPPAVMTKQISAAILTSVGRTRRGNGVTSMRLGNRALLGGALAGALFLAPAGWAPLAAQSGGGPFANLGGAWSGSGTIKLAGGTSERIRCRANYTVGDGGNRLGQELKCASDSYSLAVTSDMAFKEDAGVITGTWLEKTYGTGGFLSGRATASKIDGQVEGRNFFAAVTVTTDGNDQSVTIRPRGQDVEEVSVKLQRRPG